MNNPSAIRETRNFDQIVWTLAPRSLPLQHVTPPNLWFSKILLLIPGAFSLSWYGGGWPFHPGVFLIVAWVILILVAEVFAARREHRYLTSGKSRSIRLFREEQFGNALIAEDATGRPFAVVAVAYPQPVMGELAKRIKLRIDELRHQLFVEAKSAYPKLSLEVPDAVPIVLGKRLREPTVKPTPPANAISKSHRSGRSVDVSVPREEQLKSVKSALGLALCTTSHRDHLLSCIIQRASCARKIRQTKLDEK